MTVKELADEMSSFHSDEVLLWDKIRFGYKESSKEQALEYIKESIQELKETLERITNE